MNLIIPKLVHKSHKLSNKSHFYKQLHFRVEPQVANEKSKMSLKIAMKWLSIFGIEAQIGNS